LAERESPRIVAVRGIPATVASFLLFFTVCFTNVIGFQEVPMKQRFCPLSPGERVRVRGQVV
jgi:hypothetical protein